MTPRRDGSASADAAGSVPSVPPALETVELPWNREAGVALPAQRGVPEAETDEPAVAPAAEAAEPATGTVTRPTTELATRPTTWPATRPASAYAASLPVAVRPIAALPPAGTVPAPAVASDTATASPMPSATSSGLAENQAVETVEDEAVEDDAAPALADEDAWPSPRRQIAHAVRVICGLIIAVLLGHRFVPDFLGFGSMLDTFLPWTFVPLAVALPAALGSRSRWAMGVAALAACVWGADFGPTLLPRGSSGPADIRILSQNVSAQSPDIAAAAALAVRQHADVVVLEGMSAGGVQASGAASPTDDYKYRLALYEFTVWSKFPLSAGQPVDLGAHGTGAASDAASAAVTGKSADSGLFGGLLSFKVMPPGKPPVTVYAVHLPQPALSHYGFAVARDAALLSLAAQIKAESARQLVVVGDLDLAETDREMGRLLDGTGLVSAQAKAGSGFGFTWPEQFPMVRLDDVLVRGLTPLRSAVLGATGAKQAHRPIQADLRF